MLCYVTDRHALGDSTGTANVLARIGAAVEAGIDWIQIRERDLSTRKLSELTRAALEMRNKSSANAQHARTKIIVNDRADVASALGAAGVHLGGTSLPVSEINKMRGGGVYSAGFLIGASCHSVEGALAAEREGADYVFFGPIFETPAKIKFGAPQGLDRLADVSRSVRIPVIAIGGITLENAAGCIAAGAAGIAAIRLFQEALDLRATVDRLRRSG